VVEVQGQESQKGRRFTWEERDNVVFVERRC